MLKISAKKESLSTLRTATRGIFFSRAALQLKQTQARMRYAFAKEKADAAKLDGKTFKLSAKAGTNGRLFGSVTSKDVSAQIKADLGVDVDKRKIEVEDIKQFGTYEATVKVYPGVTAKIYVQVSEA